MGFVLELNVLVFVTTRVVYKAAICFFEPFPYLIIAFGAKSATNRIIQYAT